MVKQQPSILISLLIHAACVILLLIFSKPISVLVPSRSDGIELSLMNLTPPIQQQATAAIKLNVPEPIHTLNQPGEINLAAPKPPKQPKSQVQPAKLPLTPAHSKAVPTTPAPVTKPNKTLKKVVVNDLLGDALSKNNNAIRKGVALGGNITGTSDSNNLVANYADLVIKAVRPFVVVPDEIDSEAKAVIQVTLNPDLSVRRVSLVKSSGNSLYDESIQSAIIKVQVFPPLPDGAKYVDYRILKLTFRPQ